MLKADGRSPHLEGPALKSASVGEPVGMSKMSRALFERVVVEADLDLFAEYETGGLKRLAANYPIYFPRVAALVSAKIDTPRISSRAEKVVSQSCALSRLAAHLSRKTIQVRLLQYERVLGGEQAGRRGAEHGRPDTLAIYSRDAHPPGRGLTGRYDPGRGDLERALGRLGGRQWSRRVHEGLIDSKRR